MRRWFFSLISGSTVTSTASYTVTLSVKDAPAATGRITSVVGIGQTGR